MIFHESLNPERKFSLAIPLVFIAILGGTTAVLEVATVLSPDSSYAGSPHAQLASPIQSMTTPLVTQTAVVKDAPADANDGICGRSYDDCMNPAKKNSPERCDLLWRACVKNKCVKTDTKTVDQCSADSDCTSSCTELTAANGELKNCCSVIAQDNSACQTAVEQPDNKPPICNPKRTKLPGGGSGTGTGGTPGAPSNAKETKELKYKAELYEGIAKSYEQRYNKGVAGCAGDASCLDNNADELDFLNQRSQSYQAKSDDILKQIRAYDIEPTTLTDEGVGAYNARPLNPSTAGDANWLSPTPLGGAPQGGFSQEGPGLNNPILSGNTFQGGVPSSENIEDATKAGFDRALPVANDDWAEDFNYQTAGGDALDPNVAKAAGDASGDWAKDLRDFNYETAGAKPEHASGLLGEGEQVPLPRPAVRDVSNSLYAIENKAFGGEALTPAEQKVWDNYDKQVLETKAFGGEALTPSEQKRLDGYNAAPKPGDGADTGGKGEVPKANTPPVPGVECAGSSRGCTPTAKAPVDPNGNQTGSGKTGAGDPAKDNSGSGSGIGSALSSMLQGLMKALGAPQPPAPPPPARATAQNAYAQQQQQYQQQLQQYNYQLQQQQYKQQLAQYYQQQGVAAPPAQPLPTQPTPCTPPTRSQCKAQQQQPPSSACTTGTWRATYQGACITGWQCISTEGPKAELVCEPKVADVGSTLAIIYGCSSGLASSSSFTVTAQPGGSATTTVKAPPAGTNTATYTLACTDNGKTTGAQCSIQVSRANIILVAHPKTVPAGGTSLLSWLTTGMDSCIISSPDQPDFTARNSSNTSVVGAATTSAITTATSTVMFQLDCVTLSGTDKQATTSVSVTP